MGHNIAIIGLSCRLPGAANAAELWELLTEGRETISAFDADALDRGDTDPELRKLANFVPAAGVLKDIELFDADFFGIPAREAAVLDPQHRIFLECVWEALEDAGCQPSGGGRGAGQDIGVFAGASLNSYLIRNLACDPRFLSTPAGFMSLIGNEKDYLATRVAYKLNLHGPAITVQTACSSSLVSVHLAMQSLLLGECDVAVAGGVSVKVPQVGGYLHQEGMPFSSDGHCRPFDASGTGTVFGSGAGVVVLKTLEAAQEDGDFIYAVIKGTACNNDGSRKVGFTAPSVDGQADVIRRALALADIDPADVGYVEAHGTATPMGDPIEVAALQDAYDAAGADSPCKIGSIKSNVGHLETAAGVAGLIKTALMLKHRQLVPSLGFVQANQHIALDGSRLKVQTSVQEWTVPQGKTRCAGVSSFGMGGTNVHMVLEEAPSSTLAPVRQRPFAILPLSARSSDALAALSKAMTGCLSEQPGADVQDIACQLQTRRAALDIRQALVCTDAADAHTALSTQAERLICGRVGAHASPLVFLFCGGGAQYPRMAWDLHQSEPVFKRVVQQCARAFKPLIGEDILSFLDVPDHDLPAALTRMQDPDVMFPALFTVQHAMAELLLSWGVKPDLVMAHSNGEYAAAVLAGVMDLDTAILLVATRSTLMMKMPPGMMVAVPLPVQVVQPYADHHGASIGAENAPHSTALSGEIEPVTAARDAIEQAHGVECKRIHVTAGLHSHLTAGIATEFAEVVGRQTFCAPSLPWISTVTGTFMDRSRPVEADYWVRHLCQPVRFAAASETLLAQAALPLVLDMGPGRVAGDLLRQNLSGKMPAIMHMSRSHAESVRDSHCAYEALAKLWACGRDVDWHAFQEGARPPKQDLPAYPWQRKRHWVDAPLVGAGGARHVETLWDSQAPSRASEATTSDDRPCVTTAYRPADTPTELAMLRIWQDFLGVHQIGVYDSFIELGGTSLLATQLITRVNAEFGVSLPLGTFLDLGNILAISAQIDALRGSDEARFLEEALREIESV